jgi:hypothetical protein
VAHDPGCGGRSGREAVSRKSLCAAP